MVGVDLGQPTFLVLKDTTLSLEPLDYISFWEFLTIMAFVMFSNSGLRDIDHSLGISVHWGNFWINLQNPFQKMDTKLREMPPPFFFDGFFSLDSLAPLFSCSGALLFYVWNLLRHLYCHPFAHFLTLLSLQSALGCCSPFPKSHFSRLFSMMLDERGWNVCLSPIEGSGEDSTGPWLVFDRDVSQNSLVQTEFDVIALSPTCMRVQPEELGNPTMVSVPEMQVTGEKKAEEGIFCHWAFLTFKQFYEFQDLEG